MDNSVKPKAIEWSAVEADFWFLWAAEAGDLKGLQESLEKGASPDEKDADGHTALAKAAKGGHAECVEFLMTRCDANLKDANGHTPLLIAAIGGKTQCVAKLATAAACAVDNGHGSTALVYAVSRGHADCAKILAPLSQLDGLGRRGDQPIEIFADRARHGPFAEDCLAVLGQERARREHADLTAILARMDAEATAAAHDKNEAEAARHSSAPTRRAKSL